MKHLKKIGLLIAVGVLAIACIAGCSGNNEPTSAKEVYQKYSAAENDNFHAKGDLAITMSAQGMTMDMPISFDYDINGKTMHGTYSMSLFGMESTGESYTVEEGDELVSYSKADSSGSIFGIDADSTESTWTRSATPASEAKSLTDTFEGLFEKASFAKEDSGYLVTINGADALEWAQSLSEADEGAAANMTEMAEQYEAFMKDLNIEFHFDKDCMLTSIVIPETATSVDMSGQSVDMKMSCNIAIDQYGQIAEITVPDDVKASATDATDAAADALADIAEATDASASASAASEEAASSASAEATADASSASAESAKAA